MIICYSNDIISICLHNQINSKQTTLPYISLILKENVMSFALNSFFEYIMTGVCVIFQSYFKLTHSFKV